MRTLAIDRSSATTEVLVAADHRLVRDVLADLLPAGFRVTVAESGSAGLGRFADGHFHVGIIVTSASLERRDATGEGDSRRMVTLPQPITLEELIDVIDRPVPIPVESGV